jgi:hypothetical protein
METMNLDELNRLYDDSEHVDKELYAEMRSNVLLIAGEHYTKNVNKHFARLRETNRLTESLKLRLTKNFTHRVHRQYSHTIANTVPGVKVVPNNELEMQDQKDAELSDAVWESIKKEHKFKEKVRRWADEFVGIGEVACKLFWDPNAGTLQGYEQEVDPVMGQPLFEGPEGEPTIQPMVMDAMGGMIELKPLASDRPVFSGDFVYEPVFGFNLFRQPGAKSMDESKYLGIRKMVDKKILNKIYEDNPEKQKKLVADSSDSDFIVFDSAKAQYQKSDKYTLVKEVYYKPSREYPEGYFYIYTSEGILEEGTLPEGIFPIVWKGFDEYPTTPRGRSIIKVARPYQAEINRAASQAATHQITLGDDKVLYQAGTKLAPGALLPGVRGISYQGMPPTVLNGRTGDQYTGYINDQKQELMQAVMLDEQLQNNSEISNMDPHTLLFRSASQKVRFKKYTDKFEEFLTEICEKTLKLAKYYLPEDRVISYVGRSEIVNISEFKNTQDMHYRIALEPQAEDVDTMLGKQLTFQHVLQYVGKNLRQEDVGKILRHMPYVNNDELFNDLTIEYDNIRNDMLILERGEMPILNPYADNEYCVNKLVHRMKMADFRYLSPQIQQNYQMYLQQHQQEVQRKQEAILAQKNEYIPTGGAMVAVDMYVPNKEDPTKAPKRARVPYQAMEWLVNMLEQQGMSLDKLENMNQGALAEMAQQMGMGDNALANQAMMSNPSIVN